MNPMTDSPEDLVERVARAIDPDVWDAFDRRRLTRERAERASFTKARSAIAAFPDLSVLQGENERLRNEHRQAVKFAFLEGVAAAQAVEASEAWQNSNSRRLIDSPVSPLPDPEGEDQTVSRSQPSADAQERSPDDQSLLPCPFCGGAADIVQIGNEATRKRGFQVACQTWGCATKKTALVIRHPLEQARDFAIAAWNRRSPKSEGQCKSEGEG